MGQQEGPSTNRSGVDLLFPTASGDGGQFREMAVLNEYGIIEVVDGRADVARKNVDLVTDCREWEPLLGFLDTLSSSTDDGDAATG